MNRDNLESLSSSLSSHPGREVGITVGVESYRGKLRLRIPARVLGREKYVYTKLDDTPDGRKLAQKQAWSIEEDIVAGTLDPTLDRYKPTAPSYLQLVSPLLDLGQLWQLYTEHRRLHVSETTLKLNYARVSSHIDKLPTRGLDRAVDIREHLLQHTSPYCAKRIITQLNACCRWGVESGHIKANPFSGMAEKIRVVMDDENIDPFNIAERDAIIQAFSEHPTYHHYTNFVRFLFATGCRPSEGVGLLWNHISKDCRVVTFSEAVVNVSSAKVRKDCKTHKSRRFPCNQQLQELLLSIRPDNYAPDMIVFPALTGGEINTHTFTALCWKGTISRGEYQEGMVTRLVREGKVERYRPPFNCRHTFISMAIEAGITAPQVAKWCGNSAEIVMKHYAGTIRSVQVPEFR